MEQVKEPIKRKVEEKSCPRRLQGKNITTNRKVVSSRMAIPLRELDRHHGHDEIPTLAYIADNFNEMN